MKIIEDVRNHLFSDRLLILLLTVAVGTRALVATFQLFYGIVGFHWMLLSNWSDFYDIYGSFLLSINHGLLPYLNFGYWYPPLFLYVLYVFYLLGGIHFASIPILVADVATAPLVYLLVSTTAVRRVAFVAGLLYALSPLALFIEGYLWLSSQPMTFFLLLAIYLLRKDRPLISFLALAVSVLFKQEAVFILPVYVYYFFTKYRASLWRGITIMIGTVLSVSLPFLIISPTRYLNDVTDNSLHIGFQAPNSIGSTAGSVLVSSMTHTCTPVLPKTITGSVVVCGMTYSLGNPVFGYAAIRGLELVSQLAIAPIFGLTAITLFLSRKRSNIFELSSALSFVAFLLLFSVRVHALLVYYFIPVYALLLASARGKSTLAILTVTSVLSVFTPDQTYVPALLALITIVAITATKDVSYRASNTQIKRTKDPVVPF